ncbi:hypothetical protein DEMA109039_10500 [Deinococcus marmoris]
MCVNAARCAAVVAALGRTWQGCPFLPTCGPGEPEQNGDRGAMDMTRSVWSGYGGMDGGALSGLTHRAGCPSNRKAECW